MKTGRIPCGVPWACQILNTSEGGIYQAVARRQIPFRKRGNRLVFFEDELLEFIDQLPGVRPDEAMQAREVCQ